MSICKVFVNCGALACNKAREVKFKKWIKINQIFFKDVLSYIFIVAVKI